MSKVTVFPRPYRGAPVQSLEEVFERVESSRKEHIDYIACEVADILMSYAADEGFDISSEHCLKDFIVVLEAMKSVMAKSNGLHHPMQDMIENLIKLSTDTDYLNDDEPTEA